MGDIESLAPNLRVTGHPTAFLQKRPHKLADRNVVEPLHACFPHLRRQDQWQVAHLEQAFDLKALVRVRQLEVVGDVWERSVKRLRRVEGNTRIRAETVF